jgi:hypothetical protein
MEDKLNKIYNDPSNHVAFAGAKPLYNEAQKIDHTITNKDVRNFLQGHRTYSLMRPRRVRFPRAKTIPAGFLTDCQIDLADVKSLARHNRGHKYILVAIDVLSKRIWAIPVRSKKADEMVEVFRQLLDQMEQPPHRFFSDKGTEFTNKQLREFLEKQDIEKYEASTSVIKAALAERAIRTLKQRLFRYFNHHKTLNWINVLPKFVDGINKSVSRVHGMRPIDVNFKNAQQVWEKIYGDALNPNKRGPRFKEGDFVRISRGIKHMFEKEVIPSWGDRIFEVEEIKKQNPVTYKLRNISGGPSVKGLFYGEEMAPVRLEADTNKKIEKTYRKKKKADGTYQVKVKYVGDDKRYWIPETELV